MSQQELLKKTVRFLDENKIEYMLTGSYTSSLQGEPRSTHDIDIEEFFGIKIHISTPEDTILMKLKWANLSGGSEKQFNDALSVYEIQYEKLDMQYINYWIDKLQLQNLWKRIQQEALLP
jgi:hypothetical protein